jgi:hypothetical protein
MKRIIFLGALALALTSQVCIFHARAQEARPGASHSQGVRDALAEPGFDVNRIIRAFTQKETEFRHALNGYTFTRDATVQTIGMGGQISGEYHRTSSFVFDNTGQRFERITFFPQPTLTEVSFTNEDLEDLGGVQPSKLRRSTSTTSHTSARRR